jgi:hypothetical protein
MFIWSNWQHNCLILLICCIPIRCRICSCNNWTSLVSNHLRWFNATSIYHLLVCPILGGQWVGVDWSHLSWNNLTVSICLLLQCNWLVNDVLCLLRSYSRWYSHVFLRFLLSFIFYLRFGDHFVCNLKWTYYPAWQDCPSLEASSQL